MNVAFTGIRTPSDAYVEAIWDTIYFWPHHVDKFVSGCAYGVDTETANAVVNYWPGARLHLVVPARPCNKSLIRLSKLPQVSVEHMPSGTTYLDRNDRMIELADYLIAFPRNFEEKLRSGTWATIRRARTKGIPICMVDENGEVRYE